MCQRMASPVPLGLIDVCVQEGYKSLESVLNDSLELSPGNNHVSELQRIFLILESLL